MLENPQEYLALTFFLANVLKWPLIWLVPYLV